MNDRVDKIARLQVDQTPALEERLERALGHVNNCLERVDLATLRDLKRHASSREDDQPEYADVAYVMHVLVTLKNKPIVQREVVLETAAQKHLFAIVDGVRSANGRSSFDSISGLIQELGVAVEKMAELRFPDEFKAQNEARDAELADDIAGKRDRLLKIKVS